MENDGKSAIVLQQAGDLFYRTAQRTKKVFFSHLQATRRKSEEAWLYYKSVGGYCVTPGTSELIAHLLY